MITISLEIIIGILGLVFTGITSIAGIKYLLSSWKIRKLAKQYENENIDKDYIQKISKQASYRNSARLIVESNPIMNVLDNIKSEFKDIGFQIYNLNNTLQRFSNYKAPEFPKDFVSQMGGKEENK